MTKIAPFFENRPPYKHPSQNPRITTLKSFIEMTLQNWKMRRFAVIRSGGPAIQNTWASKFAPPLKDQLRTWMMRHLALNHKNYPPSMDATKRLVMTDATPGKQH